MGTPTHFIGGTKGSHLILDNPELRSAIGENEFFFENNDGRIVLIFPLRDKVLIGTSDLPIENPDTARCTKEEIDYFIEMVKVVFPDIPVRPEQIIFQFSGVRPLPASGSASTGQISRDHSITITPPKGGLEIPIYNLVGGKWTSFRALSEEVTDKALKRLNRTRKTNTRNLPIGGGLDFLKTLAAYHDWINDQVLESGLSKERIDDLFHRYGTRADRIVEFISSRSDQPLFTLPNYSQGEIQFITREEKVVHLDDFLLRRSMFAKLGLLSLNLIDEIVSIIGSELGWSIARRTEEIERSLDVLKERHGVDL
jgi:glycerol-3-phosphate dehydrogenase